MAKNTRKPPVALEVDKTPEQVSAIDAITSPDATVPRKDVPELRVDVPVATPEPVTAPAGKISLSDIRDALKGATEADKRDFAEAVGLSPAIGKPKLRKKRVSNEDIHNMAMATGGASHAEDFLPIPPEHIMELGEAHVNAWHQEWLDGKTQSWDRLSEQDLAEKVATAVM